MKSYGRLISILYRKGQVHMNAELRKYGLTAAELPFLTSLYHEDGANQDQLSEHLLIDKGATARTIQSLVKKGFVEKRKDATDKRCNTIHLTDKGWKSRQYLMPILAGWSDLLISTLDDCTRETVYQALESMVFQVGTLHGTTEQKGPKDA